MSGTKDGAIKAKATMIKRYGEDYYHNIGKDGGKVGVTGGFASTVVGKDGLTGKERAKYYGKVAGTPKLKEWHKRNKQGEE